MSDRASPCWFTEASSTVEIADPSSNEVEAAAAPCPTTAESTSIPAHATVSRTSTTL